MSAADGESQPTVESPRGDAAEKPVAEAVEGLRDDVERKLRVEEAKLTPDAANPTAKAATPVAPGSPGSNVAEKPLAEQAEAEGPSAEGEKPPAAEAKPAAAAAEGHRRRVLICFDDSEHSRRAVQFYMRSLSRPDDHVVLMHAIEAQEILLPPHTMLMTSYASPTYQEDLKRLKSKMIGKGTEFQALLKSAGLKSRIHVMDGPEKPGVYIVQKAARLDASLIVVGSRGLSKIRRTFMGSVSDYVLHHAGCATCVVPPQHRR